jgi:hypothetical protein
MLIFIQGLWCSSCGLDTLCDTYPIVDLVNHKTPLFPNARQDKINGSLVLFCVVCASLHKYIPRARGQRPPGFYNISDIKKKRRCLCTNSKRTFYEES